MSKKTKKIIIMLLVLLCAVIVYIILSHIFKSKEDSHEKITALLELDSETGINSLSIKNSLMDDSFVLDPESGWTLLSLPDFPVNSDRIELLIKRISEAKQERSFMLKNDPAEYGLDEPALILRFGIGSEETSLSISTPNEDNECYVRKNDDDSITFTHIDINDYLLYNLFSYASVARVPDLSTAEIKEIRIKGQEGEEIVIVPSWSYYVPSRGETVSALRPCNDNDASVLNNHITGFIFNKTVAYAPDDAVLDSYGLLKPKSIVTISFKGYTSSKNENSNETAKIVEAEYTYILSIGDPVYGSDGEYYTMANCIDSVNGKNEYSSDCVFTINSLYARYFNSFSEERINGAISGEEKVLKDEELPSFAESDANYFMFTYDDGRTVRIERTEEEWFRSVAGSDELVELSDSVVTQLMEYLENSGYFKYVSRLGSASNEVLIKEYGLDAPSFGFELSYIGRKSDGSIETVNWNMLVGERFTNEDGNECYAVTASNSIYVFSMRAELIDYLKTF